MDEFAMSKLTEALYQAPKRVDQLYWRTSLDDDEEIFILLYGELPTPNGCLACGLLTREHCDDDCFAGTYWKPDPDTIKLRMRSRRLRTQLRIN